MKNVLVRQPSFSSGNIGDLALIKTLNKIFQKCNLIIPSNTKELDSIDINNIDILIYFGNDCIAYYGISKQIIKKFLSKKKKFILLIQVGENIQKKITLIF